MEVKSDKFGRILIPKEIRTRLGLRAGQVLELAIEDEVAIHLEPKTRTEPRIVMTDFGFPVIHNGEPQLEDFDTVAFMKANLQEYLDRKMGL